MVCQLCKDNLGNVHLTRIVGGEVQKATLCAGCAEEHGVDDPMSYSLLDTLFSLSKPKRKAALPRKMEKTCPSCGMTESRFRTAGRLGCSECYSIFRDALSQLLKAMHKGTKHTGKVPSRFLTAELESDVSSPPPAAQQPPYPAPPPPASPEFPPLPAAAAHIPVDQPPLHSPPAHPPVFKEALGTPPPTPPNPPPPQLTMAIKPMGSFTTSTSQSLKLPSSLVPPPKPSLSDLKKRLDAAVKDEMYEDAASLRDQLRALEEAAAAKLQPSAPPPHEV